MKIGVWNLLLVLGLVAALAGGGYVLYQNHLTKQMEIAAQKAEELQRLQEEAARKDALKGEFEKFLNDFLASISDNVQEYKKGRGVLKELAEPENFADEGEIKENADFAESLVLRLQLQIEDILGGFGTADNKAEVLIAQFDEGEQDVIRESWSSIREENAEKFIDFFQKDREVLEAYLKLIEFYNAHAQSLQVDFEDNRVVFEDPELKAQELELRTQIQELEAELKGD